MGAEPVVVLYASISVLNWMRAATGSQCKETKRGVTCSFGLVEDQSCRCILIICRGLVVFDGSPARRALQ